MLLPFSRLGMAAFLLYGVGYIVPLLRRDLAISDATAGLHASAIAVGTLVAGLTSDRFVRRLGAPAVAGIATAVVALASVMLSFGPTVVVTLAGAGVLGVGGGVLLAWVNQQLSALGGRRARVAIARVNLVGLVAALAAPLAIAGVDAFGANGRLAMLLPIPFIAAVEAVQWRRGVSQVEVGGGRPALAEAAGVPGAGTARGLTRLPPAYWRTWLVLVLVIALEFTIVFWGASVIALRARAGTSEATTAAAGFLLGMIASRGTLSAGFGTRAPRVRLMTLALVGVIVGALGTWQATILPLSALALFVAGLGVGPLYPIGIAFALRLVPDRMEAGAARATLATGVALIGAPFLLALAAEQIGLVDAWLLIALIAVAAIGLVMTTRTDLPPDAPPAVSQAALS